MIEFEAMTDESAKIKVMGVGGAGCNAVNAMIRAGVSGVDFICVNTDRQALNRCLSETKIQIGEKVTRGLGAGSNPQIGQIAAEETIEEIKAVLKGTDLLFITCGMGGGTGTGASPVIAQAAKEMGILTIGVVTKPFDWEGKGKMQRAELGISYLKQGVDSIIVIPNSKIMELCDKNTSIMEGFKMSDDVLRQGVQGISDIIVKHSMLNVDFADIRKTLQGSGVAHIGIGVGTGENRFDIATRGAIESPLLESKIDGAKDIIVVVRGGYDLGMYELNEVTAKIKQIADPDVEIKMGLSYEEEDTSQITVIVVATGFGGYGVDGKSNLVTRKEDKVDNGMVEREVTLSDILKMAEKDDEEKSYDIPKFI